MNKRFKALAAAVALTVSGVAAADVNIGGLTVPTGAIFTVASVYENLNLAVGSQLQGVGEVTQINGAALNCTNCELTYRFGGYTVTSITPGTGGAQDTITFSGGYFNFYLGFGSNNDFNPFASSGSAADVAAATNGTLFLTLSGHQTDAAGNTLVGKGFNIGAAGATGSSSGPADVDFTGLKNGNTAGAGAIGNSNFDTNSFSSLFGGFADFIINASFGTQVAPHPTECTATPVPTGPECSAGSADARAVTRAVPEPDSIALMGLGIAALGLGLRRRRAK